MYNGCSIHKPYSIADPTPPTGVSAEATGCDSAMVSWTASTSMFDTTIANYSVRYRLTNGTGDYTTVYTASTSITLQGLVPSAGYNVSVAGINSCGGESAFVMTQLVYQGNTCLFNGCFVFFTFLAA